jgi:hypothetical protein
MTSFTSSQHNGFAVALAWPQTLCKQPGSWYDRFMGMLGFNRQHYYKAGHAAVILIDASTGECHYYDFGRYHAPFGHGRARSAATDHDLTVETKAIFSDDKQSILNFDEILKELLQNPSCHGDGTIYGAYCRINFMKASGKAEEMQKQSSLPYGPFVWNGTNCSRFVRTVILAGQPAFQKSLSLALWMPLTPTPMSNVRNLGQAVKVSPKVEKEALDSGCAPAKHKYKSKNELRQCLPKPGAIPPALPRPAQWLSGEGAGSWFHVKPFGPNRLEVFRYAPDGKIECRIVLKSNSSASFQPEKPFRLLHLSHCKQLHLLQDSIRFIFTA